MKVTVSREELTGGKFEYKAFLVDGKATVWTCNHKNHSMSAAFKCGADANEVITSYKNALDKVITSDN